MIYPFRFDYLKLEAEDLPDKTKITDCPKLTDNSLNNILASITLATGVSTKKLKSLGLSSTQATKCTTLSNWAAAQAAGWTTGY